jgi:uncharacterized protein with gpF-like domain
VPDRRTQLRAWLYALSRLELLLRADQGRARNVMIRKAAKEYEKLGHPPAHVFLAHQKRTQQNIADHYRRTIPVFGKMALRQIKSRRIEKKAAQSLFESLMQQWVAREALRKAKLIADTDRDDVIDAIGKGLAEGEGTAAIARTIRKVSALTPFRAATVARTETHAAATFGSIESVRQAEQELGIKMLKEWLPTMDDRTREDHRAMASYGPIPMDEKFLVGGTLMDRPGDPSGPAEQVIACRCALAYAEAE